MAKERLSKLQKWILVEVLEKEKDNLYFYNSHIYREWFKVKTRSGYCAHGQRISEVTNSQMVTLSNSKKRLQEKGLIEEKWFSDTIYEYDAAHGYYVPKPSPPEQHLPEGMKIIDHGEEYKSGLAILLTEKGKLKAKELLKLSSTGANP